MTQPMPLHAYFDILRRADWDHPYSDDPRAYKAGLVELDQLRILAATDDHRALLKAFEEHHGARNRKADEWDVLEIPPLPVRPRESEAV